MTPNEIFKLNFIEIRRRSINVWNGLPSEHYNWQPDANAMTCLQMVRHALEAEHLFHIIVNNRGNLGDYVSPWADLPYTNVVDEIAFAQPFRLQFFETIDRFSAADFDTIEIVRSEKNQRRKLGDYLLRIAYHESVHTGQLLDYMRSIGIERPNVWD
jgi:uncharacterized damage-inducible protein DinB